ncbi:hypothetical protein RRF57_009272 [Xylaria bambusicola]|uniref:Uncharacterized protein n=1 Tax=Xylaria bambusicola TaxID=326684 RepID=A0AAN7UUP5_9PEZI
MSTFRDTSGIAMYPSTISTTSQMLSAHQAHGHQASDIAAATAAPTTPPMGATAPKQAKTIAFLCPGGYTDPKMARALGKQMAGPMPWNTRAKTIRTKLE